MKNVLQSELNMMYTSPTDSVLSNVSCVAGCDWLTVL